MLGGYCTDRVHLFRPEKMKVNVRKFHNDTWYFHTHLVWPVTPIQFRDYVRRAMKNPDYEDPGSFTAMCHSEQQDIVIGFKYWTGSDHDLGTLVHETFHAAYNVLTNRGVVLTEENEEPFAYLQNSLFDRSLALLPRKRRK